ncbi:MAG: hypothetical protein JSV91_02295 [Phycisphaerales bacterium]|nr:MAG: hypothetical protein JSV91_02295 [Phycisphaerales bacterium]
MMCLCANVGGLKLGGFAILALLVAAGCATTRSSSDGAESATGGLRLSIRAERGTGSHALYRVEPDGTIGYGGGFDAWEGRTTWTDAMSAEEIEELKSLIDEYGWFEREPRSTGEPADYLYRIDLADLQGRRRYEVTGESPDVMPVLELLDRIARRRFDEFLETLPRPDGRQ